MDGLDLTGWRCAYCGSEISEIVAIEEHPTGVIITYTHPERPGAPNPKSAYLTWLEPIPGETPQTTTYTDQTGHEWLIGTRTKRTAA